MEKLYLLVFLILTATSCREDFVISSDPDFKPSINLNAELSDNDIVQVNLLKNIEIGADNAKAELKNAQITFIGSSMPGTGMNMVYDSDLKSYVLEDISYRVEEGTDYGIEIVVDPNTADEEIITAQTYIPKPVKPSGFNAEDIVFVEDEEGNKVYRMTLYLKLNEPEELPAYYHIAPFRYRSEPRRKNDGTMGVLDFDDVRYELDVEEVLESENGIVTLIHKQGVFVDQAKITNNEIKMVVESREKPVTPREILNKLDMEVSTLSPELYHYNIALDKEIRSVQASYTSPSSDRYSNVENGYGIFGGSSMIRYDTKLQ